MILTSLRLGTRTAQDDAQWAVRTSGIGSVSIEGLAIEHATSGIQVVSPAGRSEDGTVLIKDCVFSGVWNRSSVGQRWPTAANTCSNGWSSCVSAGNVGRYCKTARLVL